MPAKPDLVKCPDCYATVPNNDPDVDGHITWHNDLDDLFEALNKAITDRGKPHTALTFGEWRAGDHGRTTREAQPAPYEPELDPTDPDAAIAGEPDEDAAIASSAELVDEDYIDLDSRITALNGGTA